MTLVSCALHEIVVYGGGIRITPDNKQLSKNHDLAVLFGGAAVNFALCLLSYMANGGGFFCQVNFLLGALNLLPFRYFDGGRILALLANVYTTLSGGYDTYDTPRHCERFFCRNFLFYRPLGSHILTLCLLLL